MPNSQNSVETEHVTLIPTQTKYLTFNTTPHPHRHPKLLLQMHCACLRVTKLTTTCFVQALCFHRGQQAAAVPKQPPAAAAATAPEDAAPGQPVPEVSHHRRRR